MMLLVVTAGHLTAGSASAQAPPTEPPQPATGRTPLVEIPVGCPIQPLPDVVFVGTVVASDYRTARFRIDQARAGDISQFAAGDLVDVRYGIDTKYLDEGSQYLIAAVYDAEVNGLRSRVRPEQEIYGGDEIIGATETELECPETVDPMRTMHVDGSSVDSGLLRPLVEDRQGLLRVLLVPILVVIGAVFALAAIRWILTGFGRGVESLATSSDRARARGQMPRQPQPASAGGPSTRQRQPVAAGGSSTRGGPPASDTQRAVERVQQRSLARGESSRRQGGRRGESPRRPGSGRHRHR
jgi:hypothetical protein